MKQCDVLSVPQVITFSILLQPVSISFYMLILFTPICFFLVAFEFCLWPDLYSWFLHIMPERPSCYPSLPPSMPHCLEDAAFIFFFLVGNVSYYGTHFLLKTVDFVIHLCCGLGHLIPWAYSQFMSFLTSSAACWCQVPLCPFHIARVLKSSLSSLPLTPCAALLVSFWAKMGMNFHSFLQSHF